MEHQPSSGTPAPVRAAAIADYARIGLETLPETIAGMTIRELRDDYHDRIFSQYQLFPSTTTFF